MGGTSLSVIQSGVVLLAVALAPLRAGSGLGGAALAVWLLVGVGAPVLVGWAAWRALRSWWRRAPASVGRLLLAGVLAVPSTVLLRVPLGDELLAPIGYLPAGVMSTAAALLAHRRIGAASRAEDGTRT